ncbi:Methylthioribulose-1-phosphate dehydratase [Elasticomyces elasticus]|nr:Methylthioribulose-1-phosphate dehydratase [Elasticomyces elasticus]
MERPETRSHNLKPSACTPLFLAAFTLRDAGCCIHTHSIHAVLVTLLVEQKSQSQSQSHTSSPSTTTTASPTAVFEIERLEQIKGIPRGGSGSGNLGYFDRLRIPIIENTAREEDLRGSLEEAMEAWPGASAVLVRRHGIYVWGKDVAQAKTQCESLDYIFQLAVEMHKLGLPWV